MQDRADRTTDRAFGSAHTGAFNMVFCDGRTRAIGHTIDREIHARLGYRKDGLVIDQGKY